jgi:hypothetical protein
MAGARSRWFCRSLLGYGEAAKDRSFDEIEYKRAVHCSLPDESREFQPWSHDCQDKTRAKNGPNFACQELSPPA